MNKNYKLTQNCYRDGVYLVAGQVIAVPADEKPSVTWVETSEQAAATFGPLPAKKGPVAPATGPMAGQLQTPSGLGLSAPEEPPKEKGARISDKKF